MPISPAKKERERKKGNKKERERKKYIKKEREYYCTTTISLFFGYFLFSLLHIFWVFCGTWKALHLQVLGPICSLRLIRFYKEPVLYLASAGQPALEEVLRIQHIFSLAPADEQALLAELAENIVYGCL